MPITDISDLTPDPNNANKGTSRGLGALEESMGKYGAGRSIVVDKNGVVIGGNKTLESAYGMGMNIKPVHTNGEELVVVVRDDLDLEKDAKAKALAIADNRTSELSLNWDAEVLQETLDEISGTDFEIAQIFWTDEELLDDFAERFSDDDSEEGEEFRNGSEPKVCPNCGHVLSKES